MLQLIKNIGIIIGCIIGCVLICFCEYMSEVDILVRGILLSIFMLVIVDIVGSIYYRIKERM